MHRTVLEIASKVGGAEASKRGAHYLEQTGGALYLDDLLIMSEGGEEEVASLERSREREETAAEGDTGGRLEGAIGEEEREEAGMEESHKELARDMFEKITEYLNGELAGI